MSSPWPSKGCINVAFNAIQPPEHSPRLRYLDLSDCHQLDDFCLNNMVKYFGSRLTHLYLRRCTSLTNQSIKTIVTHCPSLQELSISYCPQFTDSICYELSLELNTKLKYLSMAKCQISDVGLHQIAVHCTKLRYLNIRGCEAVSDAGLSLPIKQASLTSKILRGVFQLRGVFWFFGWGGKPQKGGKNQKFGFQRN